MIVLLTEKSYMYPFYPVFLKLFTVKPFERFPKYNGYCFISKFFGLN